VSKIDTALEQLGAIFKRLQMSPTEKVELTQKLAALYLGAAKSSPQADFDAVEMDRLRRENEKLRQTVDQIQNVLIPQFETKMEEKLQHIIDETRQQVQEQYAAQSVATTNMLHELYTLELQLVMVLEKIYTLAITAAEDVLAVGLAQYRPQLEYAFNGLDAALAKYGFSLAELRPAVVGQYTVCLTAIDRATSPEQPDYDGGQSLRRLAENDEPAKLTIAEAVRQHPSG
jgi:hypothetical protein